MLDLHLLTQLNDELDAELPSQMYGRDCLRRCFLAKLMLQKRGFYVRLAGGSLVVRYSSHPEGVLHFKWDDSVNTLRGHVWLENGSSVIDLSARHFRKLAPASPNVWPFPDVLVTRRRGPMAAEQLLAGSKVGIAYTFVPGAIERYVVQ